MTRGRPVNDHILTEKVVQRKHVGLLDNGNEVYLIILHDKPVTAGLVVLALEEDAQFTGVETVFSYIINSGHFTGRFPRFVKCGRVFISVSFGRQFALQLNLSQSVFITAIRWAPNSPAMLAVVTNENVKI